MSVHGAEPNDIYVDASGKLWRCVGYCDQPTAIFEEVEGHTQAPYSNQTAMAGQAMANANAAPPIIKSRVSGGVGGLMWEGWKRIFRAESPTRMEMKR